MGADAAKNQGGAFTGFVGMNMAQQGGGINAAQLFQMGATATGKFCSECGAKRPSGAPVLLILFLDYELVLPGTTAFPYVGFPNHIFRSTVIRDLKPERFADLTCQKRKIPDRKKAQNDNTAPASDAVYSSITGTGAFLF